MRSIQNILSYFFTQAIDDWIEETKAKYGISIPAFANFYVERFYDLKDKWPSSHKKKSDIPYFKYDYDYKQKKNLFNLDSVYTKISNKPFIGGKKQELELIMMYYWLHNIEIDNKYWDEYSSKVIGILNK